ncbi:helicase-related protein [Alphaproteobacteria bacterium]|nr:helicase-related protein [Alphaproteobacteria bacterium]
MISPDNNVTFILGPTNTGKTFMAIERMVSHNNGIIGLPLRLLAREVYDKIVIKKGKLNTALITGEEQIIPPRARYFICTVEAMPTDKLVDFIAVDEIQLCNDYERGHIFTEKLLYARGNIESLFLGSDNVEPVIKKLFPNSKIIKKKRRSKLSYIGKKSFFSLPKRSAVVAFKTVDVYNIAARIKAQKGGAAVVLGALSPQTRNSQVGMFEAGEVDFIVATDAIGMGLNLNIDNVSFASLEKYDGKKKRNLKKK